MLDDGVEGTVLVIGRAAKLDAGGPLSQDLLFERLHQTRLADTCFPTEQHYLPCALLGLLPPLF